MKQHGLPKVERLLRRSEFLAVTHGVERRKESRAFLILFRRNQTQVTRLGITVTKKIGTAVVRNGIKRQVREFYRHNKELIPKGYDMVVVARRAAGQLAPGRLGRELGLLIESRPAVHG